MGSAPRQPRGQRPPYTPRDQREAEARIAGLPYVGIDGQMYQDQENPQDQAQAEAPAATGDLTPPSAPPAEVKKAIDGAPHNPSLDSDLVDSLGNPKSEQAMSEDGKSLDPDKLTTVEKAGTAGRIGPRGKERPLDVMSAEEKQKLDAKREAALAKGMSSSAKTDSIGQLKGNFEDAKKERSEDTRLESEHYMVGPRGKGAVNADSFHGPRPVKKS
ncbi:MAG TPA: hypothetical protein VKU44_06870 [Terriglobia bacterium]|nr:hypothetical protein [Terriglobia bacterium]